MLLQITTKCLEGCSHCMADASVNGEHMDNLVFIAAVELIKKLGTSNVQVTGGEPTLHPNFFSMCVLLKERTKSLIILESNGSFVDSKEDYEKVKELRFKHSILLQIRTHPIYYPNYKKIIEDKRLKVLTPHIYDDAITLLPFGRALKNHASELNRGAFPNCINMFGLSRQVASLQEVIRTMEKNGKFCKPMISELGIVHAGECETCVGIGDVFSSVSELFEKLKISVPCDQCGLVKNTPQRARELIFRGR